MERDNTTSWIIGVIVAVLIIIGGGWWFMSGTAAATPANGTTATSTATSTAAAATSAPAPVTVISTTTASLMAVLSGIPDVSIASGLFAQQGLSSMLSGKGPYTLFVPTNEAINALPAGTISSMTAAQLKRFVQYHIISGRALNIDAVSSGSVQALSKDPLNFQVNLQNGTANVDSAYVIKEYKAKNGIIYVISAVLLPPMKSTL